MRKPPLLQRLRAKKQQRAQIPMVMGVGWYSEVEWVRFGQASSFKPGPPNSVGCRRGGANHACPSAESTHQLVRSHP
ncbi:MAG TPA: hypothetical protein VGO75_04165 [Gemmatimonadaceae bacterium]|jgi:hypothetical protein|nr:hypothetical protein [Gemmatimonadaceae bacterium]